MHNIQSMSHFSVTCIPEQGINKELMNSIKFYNYLSCRWIIAVFFNLLDGPQRPAELFRNIHGMSKKVFYERISSLIDDGFITKRVIKVFPSHVEYSFTENGEEFIPFLTELRALNITDEAISHVFKCKWLKSILIALSKNSMRMMELKSAIGEISNKVLSEKLKKLERFLLVERTVEIDSPVKVKYRLSQPGKYLADFLLKHSTVIP